MSNRFNNKNLLLILGGLMVIMLITFIIKIPNEKSTLTEKIIDIDTSDVFRIEIIPKAATGKPFEFVRSDKKWKVRQDRVVSVPRESAVQNIFSEVLSIKPQSLAAVGEEMWKEYELTDSLATRIKFFNRKERVLADLMIGKFTYKQVSNPYAYGGNNIEGTSFVRLYNDEKIYAVEGFLAFSFGGKFNDWRNKSFIRCKKEDITRITFSYPLDSSFVLLKKDSLWIVNNQVADSLNTANFLNTVSFVEGEEFMDDFKPVASPLYTINIEGNNLLNTLIKCFFDEETGKYIFNSSQNPEIYFVTGKTDLFDRIFKPSVYFEIKNDPKP